MLRPLLEHAAEHGLDVRELLTSEGLDPAALQDPDARLDGSRSLRLWEATAHAVKDPQLGLHVAQRADRDTFDLMSQLASVSRTFREMGERMRLYHALASPLPLYELREEGQWAWWRLPDIFPRGGCVRQVCEFTLAVGWVYTRDWAAGSFTPRTVHFDHPLVGDREAYTRFFGASVDFGQAQTGFEIPRAQLDMPLQRADPGLAAVLNRYADQSVKRIPADADLLERARFHIADSVAEGTPSVASVASQLGTSARTLQRRLREEGTSFQQLLDSVRRELALRLLDGGSCSVAEVAERLGFADTPTFRRAFKRWTGASPRAYLRGPGA